eukprot:1161646-Pelagomonas_calceolata.AAC.27
MTRVCCDKSVMQEKGVVCKFCGAQQQATSTSSATHYELLFITSRKGVILFPIQDYDARGVSRKVRAMMDGEHAVAVNKCHGLEARQIIKGSELHFNETVPLIAGPC